MKLSKMPDIGDVNLSGNKMAIGWVGAMGAAGMAYDVAASNADQEDGTLLKSGGVGLAVGAATAGLGYAAAGATNFMTKDNFKHSKTALKAGEKYLEVSGKVYMGLAEGAIKQAAGTVVGLGEGISKAFLETDPLKHKNLIGGVGLNKAGKFAAGVVGLGMLVSDGIDSYNQSKMSTPNGMVTSTPNIDYAGPEQYGAGGDLVFAMNKNRRG